MTDAVSGEAGDFGRATSLLIEKAKELAKDDPFARQNAVQWVTQALAHFSPEEQSKFLIAYAARDFDHQIGVMHQSLFNKAMAQRDTPFTKLTNFPTEPKARRRGRSEAENQCLSIKGHRRDFRAEYHKILALTIKVPSLGVGRWPTLAVGDITVAQWDALDEYHGHRASGHQASQSSARRMAQLLRNEGVDCAKDLVRNQEAVLAALAPYEDAKEEEPAA